ncbi:MAG: histidine kinase [Gammaproteobacteria bacterium]|nr:histidine kinase [Gammaproteobacteria bacterium]MBU1777670.1 histidine kinase [Gammaproteobacteria bacterium]MBU1968333.1 histidine kinase [Gammaproteobacteria bacterium]
MKKLLAYFVSTFTFNTAIAAVLNLFMSPFWHQFVYSQCIGFSVLIINMGVAHFVKRPLRRVAVLGISLPGSVAIGMSLAFAITGTGNWSGNYVLKSMAIGLFFGLIGVITFLLFERIGMEKKQRQMEQSESEKREIEANLKLLQAQIEPHFLFNTLANVGSLIDSDPALARQLLERLNDWLRVALVRARSDSAVLGDELDMLENYLQILKIRFGERLRWRIDVAEDARGTPFPPMLLQPLVENAVRHGIEPKIGGGEIVIRASADATTLRIEVCDTGIGLVGNEGGGAGLANVRARLATLFGDNGRLTLESKAAGGVVATLELPL